MKVCLFGGSFDPPHKKHLEIVNELLISFDEVWIIVANSSPFKNSHVTCFEIRFKMCKLAFDCSRVKVLDVEKEHNFKYTYDTVKYLKNKFSHDFYFAIGSDNLSTLDKWYKSSELKTLVDFITFKRTPVSSTLARVSRESGIEVINNYIIDNNLYQSKYDADFAKLKSVVNENRYNHTIHVYNTILKIARANNLDEDKCAIAAIYHDYYKEIADEKFLEEFKKKHSEFADNQNHILHGVVASYMLDLDEEVLDAIKYHSTGKVCPSDLLKALYIADFCEPSRYFHSEVVHILVLSYTNLDEAYKLCLEESSKRILKLHGVIDILE